MYGTLDISTSGMIAQRTRFEAIASNIAGAEAIGFERRVVYFSAGDPKARTAAGRANGVHVSAIETVPDFDPRYEPESPYADERGYVKHPNISVVMETMNLYEAQRAYEANVTAAESRKAMVAQALRLLG